MDATGFVVAGGYFTSFMSGNTTRMGVELVERPALALAPLTQRIAYLEEGDWVVITRDKAEIFDVENRPVTREIRASGASAAAVEKGNYRHFMQKEIYEQPTVVAQTLASYLRRSDNSVALPQIDFDLSAIRRLTIVACGTSFYAGMVAKYWFEQFARVPVDIDVASEFRYREPVLEEGGLDGGDGGGNIAKTVSAMLVGESKMDLNRGVLVSSAQTLQGVLREARGTLRD